MPPDRKYEQTIEQAFRQCYDVAFDKIHAFYLSRTSDGEIAKDLTHDFFLKLYRNWHQYSSVDSPDSYLFTSARNLLIDHYRKSLNAERPIDTSAIDLPERQPDASTLDEEKMAAVHRAISQLPAKRQEIFKMKKLQGLTSEEVAEQLGLSKRTVENHLHRALNTLRKQLAGLISSFL